MVILPITKLYGTISIKCQLLPGPQPVRLFNIKTNFIWKWLTSPRSNGFPASDQLLPKQTTDGNYANQFRISTKAKPFTSDNWTKASRTIFTKHESFDPQTSYLKILHLHSVLMTLNSNPWRFTSSKHIMHCLQGSHTQPLPTHPSHCLYDNKNAYASIEIKRRNR